jgi:tetratricopeptide (TPR) repeat protein
MPLPKRLADELARASRPGKADEAKRWAEKLLEARDKDDAKEVKRLAIRVKQAAPRSAWAREQLGMIAYALKEWHEAAQELLAYRRFTGDRKHDHQIAETYRNEGKPARALEFLADLKSTDLPANEWMWVQIVRASSLADTGRRDAALTLLKEAVRTSPIKKPFLNAIAQISR